MATASASSRLAAGTEWRRLGRTRYLLPAVPVVSAVAAAAAAAAATGCYPTLRTLQRPAEMSSWHAACSLGF